jgi:hypothetical protein
MRTGTGVCVGGGGGWERVGERVGARGRGGGSPWPMNTGTGEGVVVEVKGGAWS